MRKTVEIRKLDPSPNAIGEILVENGKVIGVHFGDPPEYRAKAVIVTTGTALRKVLSGDLKYSSRDHFSLASIKLAYNLRDLGLEEVVVSKQERLLCPEHRQSV